MVAETFGSEQILDEGRVEERRREFRVSIVIPVFNRERYVGLTIESVLGQTFAGWEAVIFDDGSMDNTVDVVQKYATQDQRLRLVTGPNGGVAHARNRGYLETDKRAEFVIFLDSDDIWPCDTLSSLVAKLDSDPTYSAAHGVARCIDGGGNPLPGDDLEELSRARVGYRGSRVVPLKPDEPTTFAALVRHNWVLTPGTHLIRRSVLEAIGERALFDEHCAPADDWDLAIRVSRHGDMGYVDRSVLLWRRHGETLSETSPHLRRAHFRVRENTIRNRSNDRAQLRLARRAFFDGCRSSVQGGLCDLARGRFSGGLRRVILGVALTARLLCAESDRLLRRTQRTEVHVVRSSSAN